MKISRKGLILVICLPLLLAACTGHRQRYDRVLQRAHEQNQSYDSITNVDSLRLAAGYFDRHGTPNERMRAHYLLGCAYRDMGETPRALDCFHRSIDCADTTQTDFDYKELSRIHGQIADMMLSQHAFQEALEEFNIIDRYARLSDDTLMFLVNLEHKGIAYHYLGNADSVLAITERVSHLFKAHGMEQQSARSLGICLNTLLDKGFLSKARQYMDFYEDKSGYFDSCHSLLLRNKTYYYTRGSYYLLSGKADSAHFYFRRLITEAATSNNRESGYLGLCRYYQHANKPDSAEKYALLSRAMNDSCAKELSTDFYQRMQSQYNYNSSLLKAETLEKENMSMRFYFILATMVALVALLFSGLIIKLFRRNQLATKEELLRWREKHDELLQLNSEYERLKASNDKTHQFEIEEKQEQIDYLQSQLKRLQEKWHVRQLLKNETSLLDSAIVNEFKQLNVCPSHNQWLELRKHVDRVLPNFQILIREQYPLIREEEMNICILLRLHMSLKQVSLLLGISLQNLNVARKRLLKKIFKIEGNVKEFDTKIQNLG